MTPNEFKYVIYMFTCTPTGKRYIGQTCDLRRRTLSHLKPYSGCVALNNAILKYGLDAFVMEILAEDLTLTQANVLEEQLIEQYRTISPGGYNLKAGGNNRTYSSESKQKMRQAKVGKPLSREHADKIGEALRGRPRTGKAREVLEACWASHTGTPRSEETKRKISASLTGRKQSPELVEKRRTICNSEEHRQKLREAWKRRKERNKNVST